MKVTSKELMERIKTIKGATFVKFVAETEVRMNKTGNPYYGSTKIAVVAGNLGANYETVVNNQLSREDKEINFVAQPPKGKVHTDSKHFLTDEKTGTKTYLVVYPLYKSQERQEQEPTKYYFEGKEIDGELLKPFMVKSYASKSQGTEKPIIYRTYGFEAILSMTLLGEEYAIVNDAVEQVAVNVEQEKELIAQ
jgi:hypothetical protein